MFPGCSSTKHLTKSVFPKNVLIISKWNFLRKKNALEFFFQPFLFAISCCCLHLQLFSTTLFQVSKQSVSRQLQRVFVCQGHGNVCGVDRYGDSWSSDQTTVYALITFIRKFSYSKREGFFSLKLFK